MLLCFVKDLLCTRRGRKNEDYAVMMYMYFISFHELKSIKAIVKSIYFTSLIYTLNI